MILLTLDFQGLRILRTRHKSDQVRAAGPPCHRAGPGSSSARKLSGSGPDQARPDLNRNQSESSLEAGIQVAKDDFGSLSGAFQFYFSSFFMSASCLSFNTIDDVTLG